MANNTNKKPDTSVEKTTVAKEAKTETVKTDNNKEERVPKAEESAEDVGKIKLNPPTPDPTHAKEVYKSEKAASDAIADELTDKDVIYDLAHQVAVEVVQEQPQNAVGLDHEDIIKIVKPAVRDAMGENLEHRSTETAMLTKVKTAVKTQFEGLRKAAGSKDSDKVSAAKAEIITGAKSPLIPSPEAQIVFAENVEQSGANQKKVEAEIEKEQQRLADHASGKINAHKEMIVGTTYHFRARNQPDDLPGAKAEEFVGKLTEEPKGGKLRVAVVTRGNEGATRQVATKDYQINRVESSRAYELSHILG